MTAQLTIDFTTQSPINKEKLTGQNLAVYEYMKRGNRITHLIAIGMGIYHLNSRIAEVRKVVTVYSRDIRENGINCKEYDLKPFA